MLREWKDRFLAIPWVYDTLRPLVAGGINLHTLTRFCEVGEMDRVFDFGCGTGQLLPTLSCSEYLGVDLDFSALARASRFSSPHVRFVSGDDWDAAFRRLRPTVVLMIGVGHHLADLEFHTVIRRFRQLNGAPPRLVTIDVTYLPGRRLNNLLSRMDRGRHVRQPGEYEELFRQNTLGVTKREILPTRLGYVRYLGYHLSL